MTDAVKPCPNRECNSKCYVRQTSRYWVQCEECEYSGPTAITKPEAIRLHNLICTPPAGWKLVPAKCTPAMGNACVSAIGYWTAYPRRNPVGTGPTTLGGAVWEAMLLAAPENDDEQT